ncbi:Ig-like domain-containing protein [Edaphobacter modestus]|uniref:Ig-like domain-containing protein n=1 Tax=Edaphobacter modestus TaxID=388466 RepID=UPI0013EE5E8C|nr:Ig-like domain-containing protein [Edaphobacter modestus]
MNPAVPTVTATSSTLATTYGQPVTLTATLTAPLASTATGTVQWFDDGTAIGSPQPVASAISTLTLSSLAGGNHTLAAHYSGDSNFTAATSGNLSLTVSPVLPGTGGFSPVTLTSNLNPSIYQNEVTFTASVPVGATGSINFMDGATSLGSVPVTDTTAVFSTTSLVAATHPITGVYSGDANFQTATTSATSEVVNQAPTIALLTANPMTGLAVGSSVTFTALVNTGMYAPTGTVTFMDGATTLGTAAVTVSNATNLLAYSADFTHWTSDSSATAPIVGSGTAGPDGAATSATTITFPDTTRAGYSGLKLPANGTFAGQPMAVSFWAQSSAGAQVTINLTDGSDRNLQTATVTTTNGWQRFVLPMTLPAGANPNAVLSIRMANQGPESIDFFGVQLEQAATAGIYVMTTGASASGQGGVATYSTAALLGGTHPINVSYSGDSNYLGSTGTLNQALVFDKSSPSVSVTSSRPSSTYGQSVTFTANVSGPNTTPTGTVTFLDGATVLGTGTLDTSGNATYSTNLLSAGMHSITAHYAGDGNFVAATSPAIAQSVSTVAATLSVSSSPNPSTYGQPIDFSVAASGPGAVPTGTVTVTEGATTLGTITLGASGQGKLTIPNLTGGTHNLEFTYNGDSNYQ